MKSDQVYIIYLCEVLTCKVVGMQSAGVFTSIQTPGITLNRTLFFPVALLSAFALPLHGMLLISD